MDLFNIYGGYNMDLILDNIVVNGNDNTISGRLIYYYYGYYANVNIVNCLFTNIVFSYYAAFLFDNEYYSTTSIIFENVIFSNMSTSSTSKGLIY